MTKIIPPATRLELEFEEEYVYALAPPKSVVDTRPREMSPAQASTMAFTCGDEAKRWTGYEPVPIEVLRDDPSIHTLLDMLETCRPGQSDEEDAFIERYLSALGGQDRYGNTIVEVFVPEGHPHILWSCHTDTVHRHGGTQKVEVTSGIAWTPNGSCLGSDDTVGVWLAIEMIKAKVPGTYIFHRDEESGGGGSGWLASEEADYIGQFDCAIALDRMDYTDVITHQAGGRCCSDAFAKSLAALLGGRFKPCDGGVFTDTANYVDLIGECTNLSVGYFRQHGPMEHTNLSFASSLRDALVKADWTKLVFERQPGEVDESWSRWGSYGGGQWGDKWDTQPRKDKGAPAYGSYDERVEAMEAFIVEFPWVAAQYLIEMGVEVDDLDLYEPGDLTKKGGRT